MCQCNGALALTRAPAICKDFELFLCPLAPPLNTIQKVEGKKMRGGWGVGVGSWGGEGGQMEGGDERTRVGIKRDGRKKNRVRYWEGGENIKREYGNGSEGRSCH